jgi:hypothetical protein
MAELVARLHLARFEAFPDPEHAASPGRTTTAARPFHPSSLGPVRVDDSLTCRGLLIA